MGIDISKLNGLMKELATLSDVVKKDGQLEGSEVSIFKGYADNALNNGQISLEDFSAVFGIEITETKPVTQPETVTTKPATLTKKEEKRVQNAVSESVKDMVNSGIAPDKIISELSKEYTNPKYSEALNEVKYVLDAVNATNYNSKDDVKAIHNKVKTTLKTANKWDGFHKDLLDSLEKQAEKNQTTKEFNQIVDIYKEVKDACNKAKLATNFEEYVNVVKEELEKRGLWDKSYYSDAFKEFKKYVENDAKDFVGVQLEDTKGTSNRKVNKELKEAATDGDSYQKHARKDLKTEVKITARGNKIEAKAVELEKISADDLRKELGSKLFEKLERSYLGTVMNPDGTYNLSSLSDEIVTRVGADNLVNRSQDDKMAEMTNIHNHILMITGQDLSDKEIKKLLSLCEIKREKKDRSIKTIANKALLGLPGLIGGTVAGGTAKNGKLNVTQYSLQEINIKINNAGIAEDLIEQIECTGITPNITINPDGSTGIKIKQEAYQKIVQDDRLFNALQGLGIAALTNGLWALAFGTEKDEKSCLSISDYDINDPTYTDADKYKEYIGKITDNAEKRDAIYLLVDTYKKMYGNDWHTHFQQALRDMAGIGSKLNPEECLMMKYLKPEKPVQTIPVETTPVQDENNEQDTTPEEKCPASIGSKYTDTTFTYTREGGDSWTEIVRAFYPCLEEDAGGIKKAIRKLKIALSYNEDGTFNQETFIKLRDGGDLPKTMRLPAKIDGCDRVDNAEVKKVKIQSGGKAKIQAVGNGSGYYTYTAKDGCDGQTATGSSRQEALTNLKTKTGKTYTNEQELLK